MHIQLNTLSPALGSRPSKKRVGRGIGSGMGKTSCRGHKGQKARAGGYHKIHFEGGQMPIQRRLPKMGFVSRVGQTRDEVTLYEIAKIQEKTITMQVLKDKGLIAAHIQRVKVIASGEITVPVNVKADVCVTKGAKLAIEQAGGSVEVAGV